MITPADIRNPKRKSGYDHVHTGVGGMGKQAHLNFKRATKWRGRLNMGAGRRDPTKPHFSGPCRATALEAAQDYCDFINGLPVATPALPAYPGVSIDMGNTTRHAPRQEPVKVKRKVFKGPHDLYDVLVLTSRGVTVCRKVGITAKGHGRYADICKTFGLSIKPVTRAVTYPTKAAAEKAEAAKIAEVAGDRKWTRIGKEAFAPAEEVA